MLTVGRRDEERKGLGLGFGGGMEENELEEGEACSGEEDEPLSPQGDLGSLSYIDAKLQDVLGHFQKDFEGRVCGDNLGAMFGGYGSFLPIYQHSPSVISQPRASPIVRSQPRTPQNPPSNSGSRSPHNQVLKGARQNPLISTFPSIYTTHTASVAPSVGKSHKKGSGISDSNAEDSTIQHSFTNKLVNGIDRKTLKVRLKVGPQNVSARNNCAIYSGLGLDISPSSSPEGSPYGSEDFSTDLREAPDESPMTIIQIMTCFHVPGGYLLSPLPDSLLHLAERENSFCENFKTRNQNMCIAGIRAVVADSTSGKDAKGVEKKTKVLEKNGKAIDMKHPTCKDNMNSVLEREIDIETLAGREIISDVSNIPILSVSQGVQGTDGRLFIGESANNSKLYDLPLEHNKVSTKGRISWTKSVKAELELKNSTLNTGADTLAIETTSSIGKPKKRTGLEEKGFEERDICANKDSSDVGKQDKCKNQGHHHKSEFGEIRGRKNCGVVSAKPAKQQFAQQANFYEQDKEIVFEDQLPESKGKLNKNKTKGASSLESMKKGPRVHLPATSKEKTRNLLAKDDNSSDKSKKLKTQNEYSRSLFKDSHTDFGDIKTGQLESRARLVHSKDKVKVTKNENEGTWTIGEKAKEMPCLKKMDNPLASEEVGAASIVPSIPTLDATAAPNVPVYIEENWVCCDKCEKWRLLPYGINPDHLPKEWECSMLNWLPPGMSKCSISEEETTKALLALYQIPVAQDNANLNGVDAVAAPNTILADGQHPNHNLSNHMNSMPTVVKKKQKLKDKSYLANNPGHPAVVQNLTSVKRNQQISLKSRRLSDVNQNLTRPTSLSKVVVKHTSKSTDFTAGKKNYKHKGEFGIQEPQSAPGSVIEAVDGHSKSKRKRGVDEDGLKTSKRFNKEGPHFAGENWHSEHDGAGNAVSATDNALLTDVSRHNMEKCNGFLSSKEVMCNSEGNLPASSKKGKTQGQALFDVGPKEHIVDSMERSNSEFNKKKRKHKEAQENKVCQETIYRSRHLVERKVHIKEASSECIPKREKKPKLLKSEENESNTRKVDGVESLRRDTNCAQSSAAATSSSSKVSSSRKSRGNFQEARGSPVESVSSLPFRNSNSEKALPSRRKSRGKNDELNAGFSVIGSPRVYSDGEVDVGSDHLTSKDNPSSGQRRSVEVYRAVESQVLDSSIRQGCYGFENREAKISAGKDKDGIHFKLFGDAHDDFSPTAFDDQNVSNDVADPLKQHPKFEHLEKTHACNLDETNYNHLVNRSGQWKSSKSSSCSGEKPNSKFSADKIGIMVASSFGEQVGHKFQDDVDNSSHDCHNNFKDLRDENCIYQGKDEKDKSRKKESMVKMSFGDRGGSYPDHGMQGSLEVHKSGTSDKLQNDFNSRVDTPQTTCVKSNLEESPLQAPYIERKNLIVQSERLSGRGKSQPAVSLRDKTHTDSRGSQAAQKPAEGGKSELCFPDATEGNALRLVKSRKTDIKNAAHSGNQIQTVTIIPDPGSPGRKDSHSAANVLKEARDLKHTANRLKIEGLEFESTGLYFQAALKFLCYAFLLEPSNVEGTRHGEGTQSMLMYADTARLCEFCAHGYERCKEMAAAALAYKCVEVAYLKVSYFKHSSASRDRHELQTALLMVVPGESPSSSASDVDNVNNQGTLDKGSSGKSDGSQVVGSHVIAARSWPSFVRLLNYANETICAFEASRKMQIAFEAASASLGKDDVERLSSVRKVLDFSFHHVGRLLQLIRFSMESISC